MIKATDNAPGVLYRAVIRAVELGRFATKINKHVMPDNAYVWLNDMEGKVKAFISVHLMPEFSKEVVKEIGVEFVDKMLRCGLDFYDENTPLRLICLLLDICGLEDKKRVEFCSLALCHSHAPIASVVCEDSMYYGYGKEFQHLSRYAQLFSIT